MGAPKGNLNNLKNGSRLNRLIVGNLPKQLSRVQRFVRAYRRGLEDAVLATHGEVNVTHAHLVDAAVSHEQHCQVCRWLLRQRINTMSTDDIRKCSQAIAVAKDSRNRCVKDLALDIPESPWEALTVDAGSDGQGAQDATRANLSDSGGCRDD